MKKNDPITNIMSRDPLSVHTEQKVSDVRKMLSSERLHHVPVVSGTRLVGMISTTDVMKLSFSLYDTDERATFAFLDEQFSIEELMHKGVVTIKDSETVRDAARALSVGGFHALPVVDKDENLVGMVTSTDLIRYLLDRY